MSYLGVGISVKDSPAPVELYKAAFGLELGYHVKNQDGTYYHSELLRDGQPFCSVVEAGEPRHTEGNPIELGLLSRRGKSWSGPLRFCRRAAK